jgi:polyferredoxin
MQYSSDVFFHSPRKYKKRSLIFRFFDPYLNFKYHVQQLSAKLSRALFHIHRVKNILSKEALKTLYIVYFIVTLFTL